MMAHTFWDEHLPEYDAQGIGTKYKRNDGRADDWVEGLVFGVVWIASDKSTYRC